MLGVKELNKTGVIWLNKTTDALVEALKQEFPDKAIYEDEIPKDKLEEVDYQYNHIVYETGNMQRAQPDSRGLNQEVIVTYYSEDKDNLDGIMITLISILEGTHYYKLSEAFKGITQKAGTDDFVDAIEVRLTRQIKYDQY